MTSFQYKIFKLCNQREEWQEKVAYIQSYLAQTKDIDTQATVEFRDHMKLRLNLEELRNPAVRYV